MTNHAGPIVLLAFLYMLFAGQGALCSHEHVEAAAKASDERDGGASEVLCAGDCQLCPTAALPSSPVWAPRNLGVSSFTPKARPTPTHADGGRPHSRGPPLRHFP